MNPTSPARVTGSRDLALEGAVRSALRRRRAPGRSRPRSEAPAPAAPGAARVLRRWSVADLLAGALSAPTGRQTIPH